MPKYRSSQARLSSVNGGGRRYASIQQCADYLGVAERTIRYAIADGRLTAYRLSPQIVRLDLDQVDEAMAAGGEAQK